MLSELVCFKEIQNQNLSEIQTAGAYRTLGDLHVIQSGTSEMI